MVALAKLLGGAKSAAIAKEVALAIDDTEMYLKKTKHELFEDCFPEGIFVECTLVRLRGDGMMTVAPAGATRFLLSRGGTTGPTLVKLRGAWLGLLTAIFASAVAKRTERGDRMFMRMARGSAAQMLEHDTLALA